MQNQFEPDPIQQNAYVPLEQYLDQLCAPLEHDLPAQECAATRQELRAHLLLSAAAHEELGATSEEALRAAFAGFGNPRRLGRTLAQEKSTSLRAKRRLTRWGQVLGVLVGGYAALSLTLLITLLDGMQTGSGNVSPPYLLQFLLFLLGGRVGWLLASGKSAAASGPLAGLAGSQVGTVASLACTLSAYHQGWLAAVGSPDSVSICLMAGMGTAVGWALWKHPKSFLGSISLGSAVFGLPMLLNALYKLYLYPDYRNGHILSIFATAILLWCVSGALAGAAMGLFGRLRKLSKAEKAFPFAQKNVKAGLI